MKCHICNQEMRVIESKPVVSNYTVQWTEDTWWCDNCDGVWNRLKRWLRRVFS